MDNDLAENDPYRQMDSGESEIRPEFLKRSGAGTLSAAEKAAGGVVGARTGGAGGALGRAKDAEDGGLYKSRRGNSGNKSEKASRGLFRKKSAQKSEGKGKLKMPSALKLMAPLLILLIGVVAIIAVIAALPVMMIGALDYNLQKSLGFTETVGILEEQGEHVTAELAKSGEFPSEYAADLAANGMDVGQVTVAGDFIKTNVYVADIEKRNDLVAAASGFQYNSDEEGELAFLFNGEVIKADDFVARVEEDPQLFAVYIRAADVTAKYYYGDDVEQVYKDMKLSRGNFNSWKITGDYDADEEDFRKILTKSLDGKSNVVIGGALHDEPEPAGTILARPSGGVGKGTWDKTVTGAEATDTIGTTAENTREYIKRWDEVSCPEDVEGPCWVAVLSTNANTRAAELLNTAVSSNEPYQASRTFISILEPVQRARIEGNGPVNHVMNALSTPTEVSYQSAETGESVTAKKSILETTNFRAAVSDSSYSKDEAADFSRDRVMKVTGKLGAADDPDCDTNCVVKTTTITSNYQPRSSSVVRNGKFNPASEDTMAKATETIEEVYTHENSEYFQSVVGANRALEGGSFLSNMINQKAIGAMPSDSAAIMAYHQEVEKVLARKAEAERATLSPFDISSPNTFMGSIVHKFATSALGNYSTGITSLLKSTSASTNSAIANLTGTARAEGPDEAFTTMSGKECATVTTVSVEGDLYCTSHNTNNTSYMNYSKNDWKNSPIGSSLDDEGNIIEGSELEQFVTLAMDRPSTVGNRSSEVCERYKSYHPGSIFDKIADFFTQMMGLYESCKNVDQNIATGAAYTLGPEGGVDLSEESGGSGDVNLYTAYMLHEEVYSLLSGTESGASKVRARYYALHPQDNSEAGRIARISGMTKAEAEIALGYAAYLNVIANYDPSSRYVFGGTPVLEINDEPTLMAESQKMAEELYAWRQKESEYNERFCAIIV
ncbi:MAG: hypothetical protein Q4B87_00555 [Candidatus Saccharibacteria bacterium]|nr:hypothetical protein [Candidatus Saccharibacteria bacterium]